MAGPSFGARGGRQPLSNNSSSNGAGSSHAHDTSTNGGADASNGIEFSSREDVERLLAEKMKGKNKLDYKGKSEQMSDYIRKLRACIKWLLEREDANLMEQTRLQSIMESEEKRHTENESRMTTSIQELESKFEELQKQYILMEEHFRKEETAKVEAIRLYNHEKEVRIGAEKSAYALSEELAKAEQEGKRLSDQIKVHEASNKRLQEYNGSLQQYNCSLQAEVAKNGEIISKMNEEKNSMMSTLTSLRNNVTSMKAQLDTSKSLQQEAVRSNENLKKDLDILRRELQQTRDERDHQLGKVQGLLDEIDNYKEISGKSAMEADQTMSKVNVLEETCSSQREKIQELLHELAVLREKVKSQLWFNHHNISRILRIAESNLKILKNCVEKADGKKWRLHATVLLFVPK